MKRLMLRGEIPINCYFIINNNKCYIVDPGYQKDRIIDYVKKNNLEVLGILLTHGHVDHIGAIDCFDVPVYLYKDEYEVVIDNDKNGFDFYSKEMFFDINDINFVKIDENVKFQLDDKEIEVLHTPGHTVGGVCYKVDNDLYSGDTLFRGTVGKWTFPTGSLEDIQKSIFKLMDTMDDETKVYPGHGRSTTIGIERESNKYYLEWKQPNDDNKKHSN